LIRLRRMLVAVRRGRNVLGRRAAVVSVLIAVGVADADVATGIAIASRVARIAMRRRPRVRLRRMAKVQRTRSVKARRVRMVRAGGVDAVDGAVDAAVEIVRRASRVQRARTKAASRISSIMLRAHRLRRAMTLIMDLMQRRQSRASSRAVAKTAKTAEAAMIVDAGMDAVEEANEIPAVVAVMIAVRVHRARIAGRSRMLMAMRSLLPSR